jgi:glucans biosynthesis protein C
MPVELTKIAPFMWDQLPKLFNMGPLWFVAMLLIFDLGNAAWRLAFNRLAPTSKSAGSWPGFLAIGAFALVLGLASYLIRIVLPIGTAVLSFPTLGYLPQYLSFFVLGIIGSQRNWLQDMPSSRGKVGCGAAVVVTLILFPLSLTGGAHFLGGGYWQSAAYALWDSIFAAGMVLALITLFRRFFNRQGQLGRFLSRHAFTVYIIHSPVIVFLTLALRSIHLHNLLKFGLASIIGVPLCFAVAYLVRKLPLASRIL